MTKPDFENKSLVLIILTGYIFNQLFGILGFLCTQASGSQIMCFQIGNAFAISASVMAGRYTGMRGQHVAASAYILLGITHGISLAALTRAGINAEREVTMAMPMIPSLIFMFWCTLYPVWLRVLSIVPSIFFILMYVLVHSGVSYFDWALYSGYGTLQLVEVIWAVYLYKDWQQQTLQKQNL